MKKFEYKTLVVFSTAHSVDDQLNELGKEGWELVCGTDRNGTMSFVFKRGVGWDIPTQSD